MIIENFLEEKLSPGNVTEAKNGHHTRKHLRYGIHYTQEAFITNIDLTNGNESELLDNYWMPSISAGGKSAS